MIFILAAMLLREKINLQKGLAIVIVMVGLIILNTGMTSGSMEGALLGNCLVLLAVIPEALYGCHASKHNNTCIYIFK